MKRTKHTKNERGFSLLELLIATAIMLIIMAVVLSQIGESIKINNSVSEMTNVQQGLRTAHEYISRDLVAGGDGLRGISGIRVPIDFVENYVTRSPVMTGETAYVTLPIIVADNEVPASTDVLDRSGNDLTTVYVGADPTTNQPYQTDRITIFMIDPTFEPLTIPAGNISNNGLDVRLNGVQYMNGTTPDVINTAADFTRFNFNVGEIFLFTSENSGQYGGAIGRITRVRAGSNRDLQFNTDPAGINAPVAGGTIHRVWDAPAPDADSDDPPPVSVTMRRMRIVHYFINADQQLIRRTFGVFTFNQNQVPFIDTVVAEHVTRLQFRYRLDDMGQQPLHALVTDEQQKSVREVEVDVEVETSRPVVGSNRTRVSATTSTSVRNLQFREAL